MLKKFSQWSVVLCVMLGFLGTAAYGDRAEKTFLVVGEEFAPFEFIQEDKVVGLDIDIASKIFEKLKVPVTFSILPWKRAWKMIEDGEADAVFSTSRKEAREPFLWYPKEDMWVSEVVFFANKSNMLPEFKGYETAVQKKLKVGVINGNSYHDSFWAAFPNQDGSTTFQGDLDKVKLNPQLEGATDMELNLKKLDKNRIDIFPADKIVGLYTAKLAGVQNTVSYYDAILYSKGYPMPFAKNSKYPGIQDIAKRYEEELIALKKSGEYDKIRDKWLK